jgi:hypothetical protein
MSAALNDLNSIAVELGSAVDECIQNAKSSLLQKTTLELLKNIVINLWARADWRASTSRQLYLVGRMGSGKSTLANFLLGDNFLPASDGPPVTKLPLSIKFADIDGYSLAVHDPNRYSVKKHVFTMAAEVHSSIMSIKMPPGSRISLEGRFDVLRNGLQLIDTKGLLDPDKLAQSMMPSLPIFQSKGFLKWKKDLPTLWLWVVGKDFQAEESIILQKDFGKCGLMQVAQCRHGVIEEQPSDWWLPSNEDDRDPTVGLLPPLIEQFCIAPINCPYGAETNRQIIELVSQVIEEDSAEQGFFSELSKALQVCISELSDRDSERKPACPDYLGKRLLTFTDKMATHARTSTTQPLKEIVQLIREL